MNPLLLAEKFFPPREMNGHGAEAGEDGQERPHGQMMNEE
jgi:hypothetical protein